MKERRYDIDWMRVIAMLGVFVLHCTRFFCTEDWHVKAPVEQQNDIWAIMRGIFLWLWLMEMFFFAAGYATNYVLRRRTTKQYLVERFKRLVIPMYTVGLFILVVPQAYFEAVTHGQITGSFWQNVPLYYRNLPGTLFSLPNPLYPLSFVPYGFTGHLWFNQMLILIVVLTLPVLLFLKSERGLRFIDRLAEWATRRGGIFLFIIPLFIVRAGLRWIPMTGGRTWGDFLWYALYFIYGYIIAGDDRFTASIKRHGWFCLPMWFVFFLTLAGGALFVLEYDGGIPGQGLSLGYILYETAWSVSSWSATVFLLSLAAKYLNFNNKFLAYSNEAVLPFYLFHQTVILIVGWFIVPLEMGVLAKFLLIAVISFPTILLLYEVFVRRIGFIRFLFGMAPQKKQPAVL
ncbi:MAG: acyltransferase family protein [Anaerolineae bacterium]|nr:acyltransferase family protein [Anaerolineae bacterium]